MYDYEYWLYDGTAEIWSNYLDAEMQETFKSGGFYTTVITTGLRLVALNTVLYEHANNYVNESTPGISAIVFLLIKILARPCWNAGMVTTSHGLRFRK